MTKLSIIFWSFGIFVCGGYCCPYKESVDISQGKLLENGTVVHDGIFYTPSNYEIVKYRIEDEKEIDTLPYKRGCICQIKSCINVECIKKDDKCDDQATIIENKLLSKSNTTPFSDFYLINKNGPNCELRYEANEDEWTILNNGSIYLEDTEEILQTGQFAMQIGENNSVRLVVCVEANDVKDFSDLKFLVYPMVMMLSTLFALTTIIIFIIVPELLNKQGKAVICYLMSLIIAYSFLSVIQLDAFSVGEFDDACITVGYITYFGSLSIFFWMNVICYDIWASLQYECNKNSNNFFEYCIWGWGMPLILVVLAIFIESSEFSGIQKPNIGLTSCYLDSHSMGLYLYVPLTSLIAYNLILFIVIFQKLWNSAANSLWSIFFTLFFIMGIPWAMEIVSWAIVEFYGETYEMLFFLSDMWNCAQGIIVFVLFVCNKKVMKIISMSFSGTKGKAINEEITFIKNVEFV